MKIQDDPLNMLSTLRNLIVSKQTAIEARKKDKSVIVPESPIHFYYREILAFHAAGQYFNERLNIDCPNDNDLSFSSQIRSKRLSWYEQLSKLLVESR